MKIETLRRKAREAAAWRGHSMRPFPPADNGRTSTYCRHCDAAMTVCVRPLPNEIDIGGSAVAVNCPETQQ